MCPAPTPGGWATGCQKGARCAPVILAESLSPGWLPPGLRVYAIGDPHGCAARLAALEAQIAADAAARPVAEVVLVRLGDYVDRGPDSAGGLAMLRQPCPVPGARVVNLAGNHEQLMLAALDPRAEAEVVELWLDNGGGATLESYGADPRDLRSWAAVPEAGADSWGWAMIGSSSSTEGKRINRNFLPHIIPDSRAASIQPPGMTAARLHAIPGASSP